MLFSFFLYMLVLSFTGGEVIFNEAINVMTKGYNQRTADYYAENPLEQGADNTKEALNSTAISNLDNFSKIIFFILLPVCALCSRLIFRSSKLNYAEHLVINAFFLSQIMIIGIIGIPVKLLSDITSIKFLASVPAILILLYILYYLFQVFNDRILLSILKSMGFIILSYIIASLVYLLIAIVVGKVF